MAKPPRAPSENSVPRGAGKSIHLYDIIYPCNFSEFNQEILRILGQSLLHQVALVLRYNYKAVFRGGYQHHTPNWTLELELNDPLTTYRINVYYAVLCGNDCIEWGLPPIFQT